MFTEQVLPRVRPTAPNNAFQVRLRTYGMGESSIGQALEGIEAAHPGVVLGYRVHYPEVDVKVHARAASQALARDLAVRAAEDVKARLGDALYGQGDESFPEIVGRAVRGRGWRLALAESCTGGLIAHLLTSYPASDYLVGGAVTYANSAKSRLLGVSERVIQSNVEDYWMLRLVDVRAALLARGYPPLDAELELDVGDELLPENSGRYLLALARGAARISAPGEGTPSAASRPQVRLSVGALAALYTGFATPWQLATAGRLQATEDALALLAHIFAGPAPGLPDFF